MSSKKYSAYFMQPTCWINQLVVLLLLLDVSFRDDHYFRRFLRTVLKQTVHTRHSFSPSSHFFAFCFSSWPSFNSRDLAKKQSTPAVSVVPFRSNTVSPLKSPSSVRVKSGQVHIFQLRYLKRCGLSAK